MTTLPDERAPQPMCAPTASARAALRRMMLYCIDGFPTYSRAFDVVGIDRAAVLESDPVSLLGRLPPIDSEQVARLSTEAIWAAESIVDTETSSGTAGGANVARKIRFITYKDDTAEHEFLATLLAIAGVTKEDRVACVDTDPAAVMVSFPKACELLGTRESYCVSTGAGFGNSLGLLQRLQPTVLISVPSIIQRMLIDAPDAAVDSIRTVVHIGEGMAPLTRARIAEALGAEVFSYYGSSETSALGIECAAHAGVHLMASRNLFEIDSRGHAAGQGELVVTTLEQRGLPLLRYRLGDLVRVRAGSCDCGLVDPKVDVLGRSEMFASILGSKIHFGAIKGTLQQHGLEGPLQLVLAIQNGTEVMSLRLSDSNSSLEDFMRRALLADHADVEFLAASGLLDIRFEFGPLETLLTDRKSDRLIDLRDTEDGGDEHIV